MRLLAIVPVTARVAASLLPLVALGGCVSHAGPTVEVAFTSSDGTRLQGTLVLPADLSAPVPAIVVLHGAEPATRGRFAYKMVANVFVKEGMAALLYDKRGAGDSGGDHDTATYADLVEDALAAVAMLRSRAEIDPDQIALFGASESGWLTPEIAERSGGLAFAINKVGSSVSVRETVAWEIFNDLRADGASEASAGEQVEIYRRLWAYRISPTSGEREWLEKTLALWAGRKDSGLPAELEEVSESYLADILYDAGPYLERLETPFLYLYGSEDINIPTRDCVKRLEELAAAGRPVSFRVFEGEGHELAGFGLRPPFYQFLDGYEDLLARFAREHVSVRARHASTTFSS